MMTSDRMINELRTVLARYRDLTGYAESSLGLWAVKDARAFGRIGVENPTLSTGVYERAMVWFAENWPARQAWPKGVYRPRQDDIERIREQEIDDKAGRGRRRATGRAASAGG